jgi:WD40 repeat protein
VDQVVKRLIAARLLVAGETGATVEPAHDALIRGWPQLDKWLDEERQRTDNLEFQRLAGRAAAVWEAEVAKGATTPQTVWQLFRRRLQDWTRRGLRLGAEAQAGLLWDDVARSSLLEQVLASSRDNWLNAAETRFALASIEQRRLNRRLRNLAVGVLALLFVTATILAVLAVRNDVIAEGQRGETLLNQSRVLTSLARQQLETDPVAAIGLSLAALPSPQEPRPYWPEAEGALTRALQLSLEEKFLPATTFVGTQNELAGSVAFTPGLLAVGGDGLRLIDADLAMRATLVPTGTSRGATQVAWGDSGQLLSYDQEAVQLWQGDSPVATTDAADLGGPIRWAGWQPTADRVALLAGRSLWLWDDKTRPPQELWSFRSAPQGARWAPDGRRLAAWNELDDLLVWDVAGGRLLFRQDRVHDDHIGAVAWAQDGAHLATTAADGIVKIWNMAASGPPLSLDERLAPEAEPGRSERQGVQFVDERRFLTWRNYGRAGLARLWTVDGELLGTYDATAGELGGLGIAVGEDDSCLLTLHETGDIYLWRLNPPTLLARLTGNRALVDDVAWYQERAVPGGLCNALSGAAGNPPAADKRYLAAATRDGAIYLWNLSRLEPVGQQAPDLASVAVLRGHAAVPGRQDNGVLGVRWLQGGRLLSYGVDGSFRIWQVLDEHGLPLCAGENAEGAPRCFRGSRLLLGHDGYVNRLGWLPDGRLFSTGWDGTLRAWAADGIGRVALANDPDTPRLVVWDPGGALALVYPDPLFFADQEQPPPDGEIWDIAAGAPIARVPGPVIGGFWLPQGLLVSAGQPTEPGAARLIDPRTGAILLTLAEPTLLLDAVAVHGARLATAAHDGALHVWDLDTGAALGAAQPCGWIEATHVAWRPDGKAVIAGGDRGIALWDTEAAGEPQCVNLGEVTALALSPDGRSVAVGTADGFQILDVASGATGWNQAVAGEVIKSVQWLDGKEWGHQNFYSWLVNLLPQWLTKARWLRTGARPLLLTLSNDSVRLWDVAAQTEIWHADNGVGAFGDTILETAAVDEASAHVAVGDYDGGIRVWEIYPQAPESWAAIAAGEEYSTRALPGIP